MISKKFISLNIFCGFLFLASCATFPQYNYDDANLSPLCKEEIRKLDNIKTEYKNPKYGFLYNQTCIAIKACQSKNTMQSMDWLEKIVSHFVDAYVNKTDNWPQIENACDNISKLNPFRSLLCQRKMAKYHIFHDLPKSLEYSGCGTDKDWKNMENIIISCINQADYPPIISQYTKNRIITYRDKVRNQCVKGKNSSN